MLNGDVKVGALAAPPLKVDIGILRDAAPAAEAVLH
jgi:hypothetical protein